VKPNIPQSNNLELSSLPNTVKDEQVNKAFQKMIENDGLDKISKHILGQRKIYASRKESLTADDEKKIVRGFVFEYIALEFLSEKGEPPNKELSDLLLNISRDPIPFLDRAYYQLSKDVKDETNFDKKHKMEDKINEIIKLKDTIKKHPFNNDSIAIRTIKKEDGSTEAFVTGTYEMKNYHIQENIESIENQLINSKHDTVLILQKLIKFLPDYYRYNEEKTGTKSTLPTVSGVANLEEFQQIVVQPNIMAKNTEERNQYVKGLEEICDGVVFINISIAEIVRISESLYPKIRAQMNKLQRSGYR